MVITDNNLLINFTTNFCNIVEKYTKYVIISGFVAISTGRARGTEDIDILIERVSYEKFEKIHNELLNKFEVLGLEDLSCKELYGEYLSENIPIRYIYPNRVFPNMKLKFAKNIIDDESIKTRQKLELSICDVYFPSIELQIAYKEKMLAAQKDMEDAIHLREVFSDIIDEAKIESYKQLLDLI